MFTVVRYETHKLASGFLIAGFSALLYSKSENKSIVKRKQRTATSKLRNWKKIQISCTHSLHGNVRFLCVTACRSNAPRVLDIVEVSVCPSVTPWHCIKTETLRITKSSLWAVPSDKISCPWVRGVPRTRASKRGTPQNTLFCCCWLL